MQTEDPLDDLKRHRDLLDEFKRYIEERKEIFKERDQEFCRVLDKLHKALTEASRKLSSGLAS